MLAQDFQNVAEALAKNNNPAYLRSAVSRAYYAVYNTATEILRNLGFQVSQNANGHMDVIRKLSNAGNINIRKVGIDVGALESMRIDADYRLTNPRTKVEDKNTVTLWVLKARQTLKILEDCKSDPVKSEVVAAIKAHEQKISGH